MPELLAALGKKTKTFLEEKFHDTSTSKHPYDHSVKTRAWSGSVQPLNHDMPGQLNGHEILHGDHGSEQTSTVGQWKQVQNMVSTI